MLLSVQYCFSAYPFIDNMQVQERALKAVPELCETIDYAEVQGVLFPRVAVRNLQSMVTMAYN